MLLEGLCKILHVRHTVSQRPCKNCVCKICARFLHFLARLVYLGCHSDLYLSTLYTTLHIPSVYYSPYRGMCSVYYYRVSTGESVQYTLIRSHRSPALSHTQTRWECTRGVSVGRVYYTMGFHIYLPSAVPYMGRCICIMFHSGTLPNNAATQCRNCSQ